MMRSTISIYPLLPFRALNPIPTIEAQAHGCQSEDNQEAEDDERCHDVFPFCTHRGGVRPTPCCSFFVHPRERLSVHSLPGGRLWHICRTTHSPYPFAQEVRAARVRAFAQRSG